MVALADLWIPIVASAVAVFIASSVLHMVIPWHCGDYAKLPDEDAVLGGMREHAIPPGQYMFPCAKSMKEMGSPEMQEKLSRGPVGFMIVRPNGPMNMGPALIQWFVYCIVIGVFVAYLGGLAVPAGAEYMTVFRITGTIAILGYALANVPDSIWKGVSWGTTFKFMVDGVVYGLLTAGCFGWLWP